jgi:hypothetical protein
MFVFSSFLPAKFDNYIRFLLFEKLFKMFHFAKIAKNGDFLWIHPCNFPEFLAFPAFPAPVWSVA